MHEFLSKRRLSTRQNNPIPIRILKRPPTPVPIRIKARHGAKPSPLHARHRLRMLRLVGQVKDEQIVLRGRTAGGVPGLGRELEVVPRVLVAEHDAVEALVLVEAEEQLEAEAVDVEGEEGVDVVGGAGYPEDG